jgi:regulator of protease activity HflC (stomatin/prohibitin superfamily)
MGRTIGDGFFRERFFRFREKREGGEMGYIVAAVILFFYAASCLNVLREYERAVVFRLGRVQRPDKGPGLIWIWWPIDKLIKISLRIDTWDVPPQDIITRDNISVKVNAVLFYRIINAQKAVIELTNFRYSIEQLAATTLRAVLGEVELDDLLSQREKLNLRLQNIIDEQTEAWGIKVTQVQVKQVDIPQDMQRAIARQAEAERERRAKIINADGEFQASQKLADAAKILAVEPVTITLRYLQTLSELGTEKNTTIVFPIPVELLSLLMQKVNSPPAGGKAGKD